MPSETTTSPQTPKTELKRFHNKTKTATPYTVEQKKHFQIFIKNPSLNWNTGKVKIPSVFNKLLNLPRQLELPHSSIPPPKGASSLFGLSTQKTPSWSPSTIEVSSLCSHLSNVQTTKPLHLHLQRNIQETDFTHHKVSSSPEVLKLQILLSSHQFIKHSWRRN